jgi:hypothetical protein
MLAETFTYLLSDPHHWGFETIAAVVEFGIMAVGARIWVKLHDKKHHNHECGKNGEN